MHSSKFDATGNTLNNFIWALTLFRVVIAPAPVLHKDVVILGGGASGTHAAIRLREDHGKSVLLIEKEAILGGHANTYTDPENGEAFNYGVQSYIDYKGAKAFFKRFNIPLQPNVVFSSENINVDPNTGKIVPNVTAPPFVSNGSIAALQRYHDIILPWNDILLPGYWDFPPGDQIPADLLLPFKDFAIKYNLEEMATILAVVSGQSIVSPDPTLFVVKNFGTPVVEGFLENTFFDPVPFNNSLLYGLAGELLGHDVVLSSTVVEAKRTRHGHTLIVEDLHTKARTKVFTKRLLIASPPSIENLAFLDLDKQEKSVFKTWTKVTVYTAVLHTNLIPDNTSISFVTHPNSTAVPKPYSFGITWNGAPGYFWIIFASQVEMGEKEVKEAIVSQTNLLYDSGEFPPIGSNNPHTEVAAISSHSGVGWGQSVEQIRAGFIQDLYALQGYRDTWYTGGQWCPDYSSNVWAFTDTVLPKLLKGLD